jgi:hypothetical protein
MDAMLEAICEAKLHGSSALSNAYARRRRRLRLRYLSASASPLSVRRLGTPWPTYHAGCAVAFLSPTRRSKACCTPSASRWRQQGGSDTYCPRQD